MLSRQTPRFKPSSCFSTTNAGSTGTRHQAKCKHLKLYLCFPDVYLSLHPSATPQGSTHLSTLSTTLEVLFVCLMFFKGKFLKSWAGGEHVQLQTLEGKAEEGRSLCVSGQPGRHSDIVSQNNKLIKIQRSHTEWAADTSHTVSAIDASGQPPAHFVSLASFCLCPWSVFPLVSE